MKKNILLDKTFTFAVRVVKLCKYLQTEKKDYILSKQLLRSGTSIGACVREANYGESKADFIHKLGIAQKEASESIYWLELLKGTDYLSETEFKSINTDAVEIIKLLTSTLKTSKGLN